MIITDASCGLLTDRSGTVMYASFDATVFGFFYKGAYRFYPYALSDRLLLAGQAAVWRGTGFVPAAEQLPQSHLHGTSACHRRQGVAVHRGTTYRFIVLIHLPQPARSLPVTHLCLFALCAHYKQMCGWAHQSGYVYAWTSPSCVCSSEPKTSRLII